jgi:uncharacterized protein YjbI with pentapeptide repeats
MTCRVGPGPPDPSWSQLERWIWRKLQDGEAADFDNYDEQGRLPPADPRKCEDWRDGRRRLDPRFLVDLLLCEPYRSILHRKGVRIRGACFDDEIDLEWAEVTRQICLERCRFKKPVLLEGLHTPHSMSFDGSAFAADLQFGLARIDGQLTAVGADFGKDVFLRAAKIGRHIDLLGASVAGKLDLDSAEIGRSLLMRSDSSVSTRHAQFADVCLRGAKVRGQISLTGAKVGGTLDLDSAEIGQSLLMSSDLSVSEQRTKFNDVVLVGAKIGGQVSLIGAKVAGMLNMESADIGQDLLMNGVSEHRAKFNNVYLQGAKVRGQVNLDGAMVTGSLEMESADIGQGLLMRSVPSQSEHRAKFKLVNLRGVKVRGQVSLIGAKVLSAIDMDSADIGQNLLMSSDHSVRERPNRAKFNKVCLRGVKVRGQVSLDGAKVAGRLDMTFADIGESLLMSSDCNLSGKRAKFRRVCLRSTKVRGRVGLDGAKMVGKLDMDSANIGQSLSMCSSPSVREADTGQCSSMRSSPSVPQWNAEFDKVSLVSAKVGSSLDLRGAVLSSMDLTGTRITGDLKLASGSASPEWRDGGRLVLQNTSVDAIQDTEEREVWPPSLDLNGFSYRRFGGLDAGAEAAKRGPGCFVDGWFVDWLAKDEPYAPQPSQQCAEVLREMGHPQIANQVLYRERNREQRQAWRDGNFCGLPASSYSGGSLATATASGYSGIPSPASSCWCSRGCWCSGSRASRAGSGVQRQLPPSTASTRGFLSRCASYSSSSRNLPSTASTRCFRSCSSRNPTRISRSKDSPGITSTFRSSWAGCWHLF